MEVSGWIGLAWLESHRQPWFSRTGCQTYEFGLIGNSNDAGCGNREVRNRRQMALATWHWPKVAMALALGGGRMWLPSCCCVRIEYASSWLLIDDLSAVPNGFQGLTIQLHMALTILHVAQRPVPAKPTGRYLAESGSIPTCQARYLDLLDTPLQSCVSTNVLVCTASLRHALEEVLLKRRHV